MPVRLTSLFVFVAFLLGTYVGTTHTEQQLASRCLMGERMQIASIVVRCPSVPGWREKR